MEAGSAQDEGAGLVRIIAWLWLNRLVVIGSVVLALMAFLVLRYTGPDTFVAEVTLIPRDSTGNGGVLGQLETFAGLNLDRGSTLDQLYERVIMSDAVLDSAIARTWTGNLPGDQGDLTAALSLRAVTTGSGDDQMLSRQNERTKRFMREHVLDFFRDARTGYMKLTVVMQDRPQLAADLANFLVARLEEFDQEFIAGRASRRIALLEQSLGETKASLEAASAERADFVVRNRSYRDSPELSAVFEDLDREVTAQETIWIELRRQLALAKLEGSDAEAGFIVLDRATTPLEPRQGSLVGGIIVAVILGGAVSVAILLAMELGKLVKASTGVV